MVILASLSHLKQEKQRVKESVQAAKVYKALAYVRLFILVKLDAPYRKYTKHLRRTLKFWQCEKSSAAQYTVENIHGILVNEIYRKITGVISV